MHSSKNRLIELTMYSVSWILMLNVERIGGNSGAERPTQSSVDLNCGHHSCPLPLTKYRPASARQSPRGSELWNVFGRTPPKPIRSVSGNFGRLQEDVDAKAYRYPYR